MYNLNQYQPYKTESLIRVTGLEGAKAYQMPPNSTAALFDGGEDLMYIKTTDGAGFPTIRTFRFEALDTISNGSESYISKGEFEVFKKEVMNHVEQLISAKPGKSKSSGE